MSIDALWHLSPIPGGFTMQRPGGPIAHTILWEEVQEIRTYKVDLFAYDEICLAFQTPEGVVRNRRERRRIHGGRQTDGNGVPRNPQELV